MTRVFKCMFRMLKKLKELKKRETDFKSESREVKWRKIWFNIMYQSALDHKLTETFTRKKMLAGALSRLRIGTGHLRWNK